MCYFALCYAHLVSLCVDVIILICFPLLVDCVDYVCGSLCGKEIMLFICVCSPPLLLGGETDCLLSGVLLVKYLLLC